MLHYCGIGLRLRQVLNVRGRERQYHAGLSEFRNLGRIDEMKASGPELNVDDYPVEDVGLFVGEDMLDGADLVAVGADHKGAGLEAPIRNGVVRCHARSITLACARRANALLRAKSGLDARNAGSAHA